MKSNQIIINYIPVSLDCECDIFITERNVIYAKMALYKYMFIEIQLTNSRIWQQRFIKSKCTNLLSGEALLQEFNHSLLLVKNEANNLLEFITKKSEVKNDIWYLNEWISEYLTKDNISTNDVLQIGILRFMSFLQYYTINKDLLRSANLHFAKSVQTQK